VRYFYNIIKPLHNNSFILPFNDYIFGYIEFFTQINTTKTELTMALKTQTTMDENVQVYRNDFFTGFMLLIKKLFML